MQPLQLRHPLQGLRQRERFAHALGRKGELEFSQGLERRKLIGQHRYVQGYDVEFKAFQRRKHPLKVAAGKL